MSRKLKYLGSNCKPVIAETVESDTQTQTQFSPKENTMTIHDTNTDKSATVENIAPVTLDVKAEIIPAAEVIQTQGSEAGPVVNKVTVEASSLKQVGTAKATARKFSWMNVGAAGALAAISVGSRMLVENSVSEEEDKVSFVGIAARATAAAAVAATLQSTVQLAVDATNESNNVGLVTLAFIGSATGAADAMFGDSVQSMFTGAVSKGKSAIDSYLSKDEVESADIA